MALWNLTGAPVLALAASAAMVATTCEPPKVAETEKVKLGGKEFTLKTAVDEASRSRGLGGVNEIAEDGGMLFVFPDSKIRNFWMYDCVIDLDIAFVDAVGIVTAVHTMPKEKPRGASETESAYRARLKNYSSFVPAQFAIEVRPGTLATLGIKRGSKIDLDLARLKAAAR